MNELSVGDLKCGFCPGTTVKHQDWCPLESVRKLKEENARLQKALDDELRLNAKGQERELALMAERDRLRAALEESMNEFAAYELYGNAARCQRALDGK